MRVVLGGFARRNRMTQHLIVLVQRRVRLLELPDLALAFVERRPELGDPFTAAVLGGGGFDHPALEAADFIGAGRQSLPGFLEQVLGQVGAGLQCLEARVLHVHRVAMLVVGLVERSRQPLPIGLRVGETGFDRLETVLRGG